MEKTEQERSEYFQSIARFFFKQRGAPFFLSSKDLDLIARWEKRKIPLPVVLEGIRRCFENYARKPGKKTKIQTLAFCEMQVLRDFDQHRERRVGLEGMRVEREEKRERALAEVMRFLEALPPEVGYLKEAYSRAQELLSRSHVDEEELERLESEVEALIWNRSPEDEKRKAKREAAVEFKWRDEEGLSRISRIKRVKSMRDKHEIPYISLFYY
ncbi:MAG: hypothetical protein OEZ45_04275 [Candidatus Aminicenantes bacterium]|nr:hypothetical protein [Candidatus Aminicenantes bacterium]